MKNVLITILFSSFIISPVFAGQSLQKGGTKAALRAAIFIQNKAGSDFQDKVDTFNDLITTRFTEKGFTIIDKNEVLAKFRESRNEDISVEKIIKIISDLIKTKKTEVPVEDTITDAGALRIAQMIGADYLIFATINSFGQEQRLFKGQGTVYGTDNAVTDCIMRLAIKVCEGSKGGTIYGDIIPITERVPQLEHLDIRSSDIINKLFDSGSVLAANNISDKIERIREAKVEKGAEVEFTIDSNAKGAIVELDGTAIGSAPGHFRALTGLHQLRLSKERFVTWEKTVNIHSGQVLNINLELSGEGTQRAIEDKNIPVFNKAFNKDNNKQK